MSGGKPFNCRVCRAWVKAGHQHGLPDIDPSKDKPEGWVPEVLRSLPKFPPGDKRNLAQS